MIACRPSCACAAAGHHSRGQGTPHCVTQLCARCLYSEPDWTETCVQCPGPSGGKTHLVQNWKSCVEPPRGHWCSLCLNLSQSSYPLLPQKEKEIFFLLLLTATKCKHSLYHVLNKNYGQSSDCKHTFITNTQTSK